MWTAGIGQIIHLRNENLWDAWQQVTQVTNCKSSVGKQILPASKHDDGAVCGCQLLFQLSDHDSVVGEGLLHCQQADLRDVEGFFAKRQRFAIVPLEERERRTKVFKGNYIFKTKSGSVKVGV